MKRVELQNTSRAIGLPYQKVLLDGRPLSNDLLHGMLDEIYSYAPPFTGYIRFSSDDSKVLLLLFMEGTPYGAGRCGEPRSAFFSIHDFGRELVKSTTCPLSVTLCETNPVLLNGIQLYLQKDPTIKAPTTLIDFESTVRHIGKKSMNAMVALTRGNNINFFFFEKGKGTQVYYGDRSVKRPEGMTIDEEMMLYAFQPGDTVQAYIFHDMTAARPEHFSTVDKESLYTLLTVGFLEKRSHAGSNATTSTETKSGTVSRARSIVLTVEAGPFRGKRFRVVTPCSIGRKDCDVTLDDRLVSRRHAEIRLVDGQLVIEDLASTNGTMVNRKKITTSSILANDLISIGSLDLRISVCPNEQEGIS